MGDSPEKKTIRFESLSVKFVLIFLIITLHDTMPSYKYKTYYKTLINHKSRCSNSRQEEVWEQWDSAKWEGIWNQNSKCCYSLEI